MLIDGVRCDHKLELISCVGRTETGLLIERRMCAQCRILCYVRRVPDGDSPTIMCDAKIYPPDRGEFEDIAKRFLHLAQRGTFPP